MHRHRRIVGSSSGSRTRKVAPSPGSLSTSTRAVVRGARSRPRWPARAPCRWPSPVGAPGPRLVGPVEALEDPLGLLRGQPRPGVGDLDHGPVAGLGAAAAASPRRPAGCASARWSSGCRSPAAAGRRRRARPGGPASGGMSSSIVRSGRDRPGRLHRVDGQHRQLHRGQRERPLPVQPGQQQQVLDQQAHPGRLVLDPAHQPGAVLRASRPRPAGTARRSRGSWSAAYAARARRRRRTAASAPPSAAPGPRRPARPRRRPGRRLGRPGRGLGRGPRGERGLDLGQHRVERAGEPAQLGLRLARTPGSGSGTRRVRSPPAIAAGGALDLAPAGRRLLPHDRRADRGQQRSARRRRPARRSRSAGRPPRRRRRGLRPTVQHRAVGGCGDQHPPPHVAVARLRPCTARPGARLTSSQSVGQRRQLVRADRERVAGRRRRRPAAARSVTTTK